ncbi:MAG: hypothetical protein Q8K74_01670 [Candidatus Nitrotoga sp.]|nr:hypothetical protein [Candidatus Nitrotoga sp.]MDP1854744.1 hypothetical protein [Candidatus Nitrotoga sp.]
MNLRAIPEVREWFANLFEAWPYWSFFASRIDQTVPLVLTLLLSGETVAGEPGQNELIQRLEIGEEVNGRVTQDFMEAVQALFN